MPVECINCINCNKKQNAKHNLRTAVETGAITAGIQALLFPAEVKAAIKNTALGQDVFLKNAGKAAVKTIKNFEKADKDKQAYRINIGDVINNAKTMYPEMLATSKSALKVLGKTFVGVAAGVMIGNAIADVMFNKKEK